MLYLTLTAILIGSFAIETSADKLVVSSTADDAPKGVTALARKVTPIARGRVGWTVSYTTMIAKFPTLDFNKELSKQLTATFDGKPLNNLDISVNMWTRRITTSTVPGNIVATYKDNQEKFGLYHQEGNLEQSDFYFEADE